MSCDSIIIKSPRMLAGDFDSFASLIKATRLRDAERKAQQAKANTAPSAAAAAADRPVSRTDSGVAPLEVGRPQALPDAAVSSNHTNSMTSAKMHHTTAVQPAHHTNAVSSEQLNPSDGEMLLTTSAQHRQQPSSDAQSSQHRKAADQSQIAAVQDCCNTRRPEAQDAAAQRLHTGPVAAYPAGPEASHDHSVRQLGSHNANRHDSTLNSEHHAMSDRAAPAEQQSASDTPGICIQDHQAKATFHGVRDRLSGESFEFDIDDGLDGMQQPDMQHARALQHSQLLNTSPALLSQPVQPKQNAATASSLASKSSVNGVLHSYHYRQSTADALGELDAVVADSDSE